MTSGFKASSTFVMSLNVSVYGRISSNSDLETGISGLITLRIVVGGMQWVSKS
jgi:hypothetical protein